MTEGIGLTRFVAAGDAISVIRGCGGAAGDAGSTRCRAWGPVRRAWARIGSAVRLRGRVLLTRCSP